MKLDPAIVLVVKRIAQEFKKLRQMIASLPSTAGLPGPPGAPGAAGPAGAAGANGVDGVTSFNSAPITPVQSGTVNNWNPAGLASANVIRLTNAETVGLSITGITAKNSGDFLFLINASQYAIEVLFDNAGSLIANRVTGAPDYGSSQVSPMPVSPGQTAVFIYHTNGGQPTWFFIGSIGDGVWDIRQPPSSTSVSAAGILSPSRKFTRVTSAAANLKGIASLLDAVAASTPFIWNELSLWNVTGGTLLIEHEDAGTASEKRIATPTSASITWPINTEARFVYDSTASRWRLLSDFGSSSTATATDIWASDVIPAITNGPSSNTSETAGNFIGYDTLDFDQTTEESATVLVRTPPAWVGSTFTVAALWTADSGSGGVVWKFSARMLANDDPIDSALGTEQASTDTLLAAGDVHESPTTSSITPSGTAAASRLMALKIARWPANAGDTLAADARLIGLRIFW